MKQDAELGGPWVGSPWASHLLGKPARREASYHLGPLPLVKKWLLRANSI